MWVALATTLTPLDSSIILGMRLNFDANDGMILGGPSRKRVYEARTRSTEVSIFFLLRTPLKSET
jgi:hypothetical protein